MFTYSARILGETLAKRHTQKHSTLRHLADYHRKLQSKELSRQINTLFLSENTTLLVWGCLTQILYVNRISEAAGYCMSSMNPKNTFIKSYSVNSTLQGCACDIDTVHHTVHEAARLFPLHLEAGLCSHQGLQSFSWLCCVDLVNFDKQKLATLKRKTFLKFACKIVFLFWLCLVVSSIFLCLPTTLLIMFLGTVFCWRQCVNKADRHMKGCDV